MKVIRISDKNKGDCEIKIDENSLKKEEMKNGRTRWFVKYEVFDNEGMAGQGELEARCKAICKYSPKEILSIITTDGAEKIKKAIGNDQDISSLRFVIHLN